MHLKEREEAIKRFVNILRPLEKQWADPSQDQIDKLYRDIHSFMSDAISSARSKEEACLFVIGEAHPIVFGKSSLVVETIFLQVGKDLGIKNLFVEGTEAQLTLKQKFIVPIIQKKNFADLRPSTEIFGYLLNQPIIKSFTIIPTEQDEGIIRELTYEERERAMSNKLTSYKGSAIFRVGLEHLKGICGNKQLAKKTHVYAINTIHPKILETMYAEDSSHIDLMNFILSSKQIKQFYLEAKLIDLDPKILLEKIDIARRTFNTAKEMPNNVEKNTVKNIPTTSHIDLPSFMQSNIAADEHGFKALSDREACTTTRATHLQIRYPYETVSIQNLIEIGFWTASKLGLCENPFRNGVKINFSDSFTEQQNQSLQKEAAAELFFSKQHSSLEAAIHHVFAKKYSTATSEEKQQQRKFIIDLVNGDHGREIQHQFDKLIQIQNDHERSKQMVKLLKRAEKAEQQGEMKFNFP